MNRSTYDWVRYILTVASVSPLTDVPATMFPETANWLTSADEYVLAFDLVEPMCLTPSYLESSVSELMPLSSGITCLFFSCLLVVPTLISTFHNMMPLIMCIRLWVDVLSSRIFATGMPVMANAKEYNC